MQALFETHPYPENSLKSKALLPNTYGFEIVSIDHIIRMEAFDNYTRVFVIGEPVLCISRTLKYFERLLDNHRFFRAHRSHIINFSFLRQWTTRDQWHVILADGNSIPISRRKQGEFVEKIQDWMIGGEKIENLARRQEARKG